jgi:hypothetical protein
VVRIPALEAYHSVLNDPGFDLEDIKSIRFYDDEVHETVDAWTDNDGLPSEEDRREIDELYEGLEPSITSVLEHVDASPDEIIRYLSEQDYSYNNPGQEVK